METARPGTSASPNLTMSCARDVRSWSTERPRSWTRPSQSWANASRWTRMSRICSSPAWRCRTPMSRDARSANCASWRITASPSPACAAATPTSSPTRTIGCSCPTASAWSRRSSASRPSGRSSATPRSPWPIRICYPSHWVWHWVSRSVRSRFPCPAAAPCPWASAAAPSSRAWSSAPWAAPARCAGSCRTTRRRPWRPSAWRCSWPASAPRLARGSGRPWRTRRACCTSAWAWWSRWPVRSPPSRC